MKGCRVRGFSSRGRPAHRSSLSTCFASRMRAVHTALRWSAMAAAGLAARCGRVRVILGVIALRMVRPRLEKTSRLRDLPKPGATPRGYEPRLIMSASRLARCPHRTAIARADAGGARARHRRVAARARHDDVAEVEVRGADLAVVDRRRALALSAGLALLDPSPALASSALSQSASTRTVQARLQQGPARSPEVPRLAGGHVAMYRHVRRV